MSFNLSSFEKLPLEIQDPILTFLADFATLRNAVLSCKGLHAAYELRKCHILQDVVENDVGPTIPLALAIVRGLVDADPGPSEMGDSTKIWRRMNDTTSCYWDEDFGVKEAYKVGEIVKVARELEAEFSMK